MKFIPTQVSQAVGRTLLHTQKHSPTILFVTGLGAVIAGTVLACKATLELERVLEEVEDDIKDVKSLQHSAYSDQDRARDTAYLYGRTAVRMVQLYAPAVIVGGVGVGCLVGSHRILTKRNVALTAAYAALEKGYEKYRQRVIDEFGADKERELRYGSEKVVETKVDANGKSKEVTTTRVSPEHPSIYARFFDEYSPRWEKEPEYNRIFLQCQQNWANDLLLSRGHIFLNEVYDMLGIDRSKAGAVVGWVVSKHGDNYVDFGIFDQGQERIRDFVNGREGSILLDFNVDGVIYDKI